MVDGEGQLGHADSAERAKTVSNHHKWVDAAKFLGCHSIRVNAGTTGNGSFEEKQKLAADGLRRVLGAGHAVGVRHTRARRLARRLCGHTLERIAPCMGQQSLVK